MSINFFTNEGDNSLFKQFNGVFEKYVKFKEELADVFIYAYLRADQQGLDVEGIVNEKLKTNQSKYPVEKANWNTKKYD